MALRHDAFISYSHAVDGKLAAALERGLEKLAKPLLKLRALDVFRDQTSLTASPALWPGIVSHLDVSEWFLLLASPASAASVWCNKEVRWWLDNRSASRLLVLLTEGDIFWDSNARDFDWSRTTAVPRILQGQCEDEPLYVDLRWARASELLSLRSAQFRDAVVNVAAPLRGVPRDELDGADLRQLARNRLLVRGGVAAITATAAVAIWQAIVANQQKVEAERQRDIAIARQLGAQAELMRTQQPDRLPLALLMATESARAQPESIEAQHTLRGVLSHFPQPTLVLPHSEPVVEAVFSRDQTQVATAAGSDSNALWMLPEARRVATLAGANRIVAFSPGGQHLVGCCKKIGLWNRAGAPELSLSTTDLKGEPENITFSADGKLLGIGIRANQPGFAIVDLETRQLVTRYQIQLSGNATAIAFAPDGALLFAPRSEIQVHTGSSFELTATLDPQIGALHRLAIGAQGRYLAASSDTKVAVFDLSNKKVVVQLEARSDGPGPIRHLAFDASGSYLGAVGELDTGTIWRTGAWREVVRVSHGGLQGVSSLSFDPSVPQAVSCGTDGNCFNWSLLSGQKLQQFSHVYAFTSEGPAKQQMLSGTFASHDSVLVTGGADGTARVWKIVAQGATGSSRCVIPDPYIHTSLPNVRSWGSYSAGQRPRLTQRTCDIKLPNAKGSGTVTTSPTGEFAAMDVPTDTARVWNVTTGKILAELAHADEVDWDAVKARLRDQGASERNVSFKLQMMQSKGSVRVHAVSPSGKRVATVREADMKLRIWDTDSANVLYSESVPNESPTLLEFLSDTKLLRMDRSGTLSMLALPEATVDWSVNPGEVTAVTLTADRRRIAAATSKPRSTLHTWDSATGKPIFEQPNDHAIGDLIFDPSGRYLVALSPELVVPDGLPWGVAATVWDIDQNRPRVSVPEKQRIIALAFSPDSAHFAAMSHTGDLRVWHLASGAVRQAVTADPGPVAFSANGQWIATGHRSIRVLNAGSLQPLTQLDIGGDIRDIEFRAADTLIAARRFDRGSTRGVVELHRWKPADMLAESCSRMPIAAAESQWRQLFPEQRIPSPCKSLVDVPMTRR